MLRAKATPVVDDKLAPGKVAIFATCFVNYNEPGIGHDLLKVLLHNSMPYAIADDDLDRENAEKTSAVQVVCFEFSKAAKEAVRAGAAVKIGCDHSNYPAHVDLAPETLACLAGGLV